MLQNRITEELKTAMKSKDSFRVGVLRMVTAAIHNREIENRTHGKPDRLTEDEVIEVLRRETKKRAEAAQVYSDGGRPDLAAQEYGEVTIVREFLGAEMSDAEIVPHVERAIAATGAREEKDIGKVMAAVMKELKGKADGSRIGNIVKEKLSA